ncbi:alpha/beta fold hydrolase [Rubrobacter marinus]|uniref:Alpha/beta fold hydrolase n=1 Tax=Rubrobacter marinus TaxID=2653852 RepID=A0A6G8PWT5_9ACTN|nr:alpha/beta fold hydrolase [Rubrobacter marinus]QIN78660.1 alpha/beta fold hydrolase [Rubrobacter marinus]
MKTHVLFVHGGGEGAYEEDRRLAASLQDALGAGYGVQSPRMPNEDSPEYGAWRDRISEELAGMDGDVVLMGHSLGASILLRYLSEEGPASVYADLERDGVLPPGSRLDAAAAAKPGEDADALMKEKRKLDGLHLAGAHGEVAHEVVTLPGRSPSLAVSGFFSAASTNVGERWCALNVFPSNGDHHMVFSYRRFNELAVRTTFPRP